MFLSFGLWLYMRYTRHALLDHLGQQSWILKEAQEKARRKAKRKAALKTMRDGGKQVAGNIRGHGRRRRARV